MSKISTIYFYFTLKQEPFHREAFRWLSFGQHLFVEFLQILLWDHLTNRNQKLFHLIIDKKLIVISIKQLEILAIFTFLLFWDILLHNVLVCIHNPPNFLNAMPDRNLWQTISEFNLFARRQLLFFRWLFIFSLFFTIFRHCLCSYIFFIQTLSLLNTKNKEGADQTKKSSINQRMSKKRQYYLFS